MNAVYKYTLTMDDWVTINMPRGAEPLCVQVQDGHPCLWARVDPSAPRVARNFRIAGTGHDLGSDVGRHIDSFQMANGSLVFHVFAEAPVAQAQGEDHAK